MPEQPIAKARSHPLKTRPQGEGADGPPPRSCRYAELHCVTNFTFHRGASHPDELVDARGELGYRALAITDDASLARSRARARRGEGGAGCKLLVGARSPARGRRDGRAARDRPRGLRRLSRLLTTRTAARGERRCVALQARTSRSTPKACSRSACRTRTRCGPTAARGLSDARPRASHGSAALFGARAPLAASCTTGPTTRAAAPRSTGSRPRRGFRWWRRAASTRTRRSGGRCGTSLLAIGHGCTVAELGLERCPPHGERALRPLRARAARIGAGPSSLARTLESPRAARSRSTSSATPIPRRAEGRRRRAAPPAHVEEGARER